MARKVKTVKEAPEVTVLRDRQIRQMADLDEEENRRLKPRRSQGVRAFRPSGGGAVTAAAAGRQGGRPAGGGSFGGKRGGAALID